MKLTPTTAYRIERYRQALALLFIVTSCLPPSVFAQDQRPPGLVTVTVVNRPFPEALSIIETKIPYKFAYSSELARAQKNISITAAGMPLADFLRQLFQGTSLTWQIIGDQIVLQSPAP